jgi:hypothetical protein
LFFDLVPPLRSVSCARVAAARICQNRRGTLEQSAPGPINLRHLCSDKTRQRRGDIAAIFACTACLAAAPAFAATQDEPQNPIVLAGAHVCVGPACVGTDEPRWRHHREGYDYDRGGCRDVTVRKRAPDGDMIEKHIRRCD